MRMSLLAVALALPLWSGSAQALELLTNGGLDDPPVNEGDSATGWTLDERLGAANTPAEDTASFPNFGDRTGDGRGLWLRSFEGFLHDGDDDAADAILTQIVPGIAGFHYAFSGWSKWEENYSGGLATVTGTFLELRFLDAADAGISGVLLDLRTEQQNDAAWRQHVLNAVAPAGTAKVLVTAYALDMLPSDANPQSAFFDDFSLECRECVVPEPASAGLCWLGLAALAAARVRRGHAR
jgi:hypothetical protein